MKTNIPKTISESNLSIAWAEAFLHVLDGGGSDCLVVALRNFPDALPPQESLIASAIDDALAKAEIPLVKQTAFTIVPYERWLRTGKPDIVTLSDWYLTELLPRLKARCSKNRYGTYFERLVGYSGVRTISGREDVRTINQLEFVISLWKKGEEKGRRPRRSALQLACFDPAKDDTGSALAGFPCLQQISLTYHESGTLELNAFYPTQYIFDRAYGNYLGLCQLGHFLADQLGLKFTAFTCFVAHPELGNGNQSSHAKMAAFLRERIAAFRDLETAEASK